MNRVSPAAVIDAARRSLLSYCVAINPNYKLPAHVRKISSVLQRVDRGELKRVIITIPPRHGKSMLVSQYFPAWWLGRNTGKYLIAASYGQDLADDFGRRVRDQLTEPFYQQIFNNTQLTAGSRAVSRFSTTTGGEYYAVGAGAAITGRGAHGLLIDDPIKSREDAESPTLTRKLIDWYESTAYSRLMPGGWIAVVCQRWNDQDLVGHLLRNHAHEGWYVVNMPALSDDGEALWPEQYSVDALAGIERAVGPYNWASQYQQQPVMRGTAVLDVSKINGFDSLPKIDLVVTACDPAISKSASACNTAFSTLGLTRDGRVYNIETIADKWGFLEQLQTLSGVISRHRPFAIGVESNQYQEALVEAARRDFPNVRVISIKAIRDKYTRATTVSHIISDGRFYCNDQKLIAEIAAFDPALTGDAKKDRVDAMVHALHMIQKFGANIIKQPEHVCENRPSIEIRMERHLKLLRGMDDDSVEDFDLLREQQEYNGIYY